MLYSRRSRYSRSPYRSYSRSVSRIRSRRSDSIGIENPGNNLYVTGLSSRVTGRELEKHFSTGGKVEDVNLVVDPWSRESRGFGFVTMTTVEEADRCIRLLNNSVLEGRVITVEKARRRRGRTPTPGRYLGLRTIHVRRRSSSLSAGYRSHSGSSPRYSYDRCRSRSRSNSPPYYSRRRRSYSPYYSWRRYSSYKRERSDSRSGFHSPYSRSPINRRDRAYSPYYRDYSPDYGYCRSHRYRSPLRNSPYYRDYSLDYSHRRSHRYRSPLRNSPYYRDYSPDYSYRRSHRYCSPLSSVSPRVRKYSRRNYTPSVSPRSSRSYSRSASAASSGSNSRNVSPLRRRSRRIYSRNVSPLSKKSSRRRYPSRSISPRGRGKSADSRDSYYSGSHSRRSQSASASSRSDSRSVTPSSSD